MRSQQWVGASSGWWRPSQRNHGLKYSIRVSQSHLLYTCIYALHAQFGQDVPWTVGANFEKWFQVLFGTTYLFLRVYHNPSLFPTPRGPDSYGSNATSKDASSWLLPALCSELTCQFIDSNPAVLARIPLCIARHLSRPIERQYVSRLVQRVRSSAPWILGHGREVVVVCLIWTALHRNLLTMKEVRKR